MNCFNPANLRIWFLIIADHFSGLFRHSRLARAACARCCRQQTNKRTGRGARRTRACDCAWVIFSVAPWFLVYFNIAPCTNLSLYFAGICVASRFSSVRMDTVDSAINGQGIPGGLFRSMILNHGSIARLPSHSFCTIKTISGLTSCFLPPVLFAVHFRNPPTRLSGGKAYHVLNFCSARSSTLNASHCRSA